MVYGSIISGVGGARLVYYRDVSTLTSGLQRFIKTTNEPIGFVAGFQGCPLITKKQGYIRESLPYAQFLLLLFFVRAKKSKGKRKNESIK